MTAESKLARWARSARELPRRVPPKPRSAAIAGLIAVLAGASLAVAPVTVFDTRVDWPARDATTDSTVLLLTNQTPYSLDLRFDSAAVTAAEGDVLFATMEPSRGDARELGLVIDVDSTGSTITVETAGQTADLSAADAASWQLIADSSGTRIQADGAEVASWPSVPPPQIDALITSAIGLSAADLSANLQVVDDPASQPTIVKIALMIVMWTALLIALFTLRRDDRSTLGPESESASTEKTTGSARRRFRIILVITDVLVVTAMTAWIFIGPMTDDDGYYAHMADNYLQAGYVGNYYQLFNQPFTPFTWFWQFLGIWQAIGGSSPVWLRVPSLIACLIAWFICRTLLARLLAGRDARLIAAARLTLAVFFVAWWSAFTIGSRPEGVGALGFAIALALTLRSIRTSTLLPAAFAALAAGLAFAAHPTGAVAFAPVILGIPHFWRVARRGGASLATAVCRTTATLSVGSVALFAAFADASLHDMQLNSARFAAVEKPQDWRDEWNRYNFLLSADPMGSYAKRAVVLIALVALVWFVIAWVTHRFAGRTRAPRAFTWIGWSLLLGFLALWITTSKWTHHFGALSTVGPLLIAVVLFYGPVLVADILKTERLPIWVPVVAAVSFVPPIIVAMRGPNLWAYAWNQFMYRSGLTPGIGPLPLGATAMWGAITVVAIAVGLLVARRRARPHLALFAPAAMVLIMGVLSTGFLYGSFGLAAVKTNGRYSPGASNIADPFGTQCRVEDAITLWDAADSAPLDPVFSTSAVDGATDIASPFRPGAVLIDNGAFVDGVARAEDAPPAGVGDVVSTSPADATAGAATSSWFALPAELAGGQRIVASVGGDAGPESTNGLIVQVGRLSAGVVTIERESWLTDSAERPGWRTLQLPVIADDLGSNGVIRLIGVDGSALPGAWFGFSGPSLSNGATMRSVVGDAPSAVAWQSTFWFPCARPAVIASGIIEPPAYSTTFGDGAPDNIWVDRRGGILAGAARIATVNTPASDMDVVGYSWGRVQLFDYPFRTDGYTLERTPVTTLGIGNPFGQPSQLIDWSARR